MWIRVQRGGGVWERWGGGAARAGGTPSSRSAPWREAPPPPALRPGFKPGAQNGGGASRPGCTTPPPLPHAPSPLHASWRGSRAGGSGHSPSFCVGAAQTPGPVNKGSGSVHKWGQGSKGSPAPAVLFKRGKGVPPPGTRGEQGGANVSTGRARGVEQEGVPPAQATPPTPPACRLPHCVRASRGAGRKRTRPFSSPHGLSFGAAPARKLGTCRATDETAHGRGPPLLCPLQSPRRLHVNGGGGVAEKGGRGGPRSGAPLVRMSGRRGGGCATPILRPRKGGVPSVRKRGRCSSERGQEDKEGGDVPFAHRRAFHVYTQRQGARTPLHGRKSVPPRPAHVVNRRGRAGGAEQEEGVPPARAAPPPPLRIPSPLCASWQGCREGGGAPLLIPAWPFISVPPPHANWGTCH
ncbi:hypothetical protein V8E53_012754 [Lactarius tabidus]